MFESSQKFEELEALKSAIPWAVVVRYFNQYKNKIKKQCDLKRYF